MVQAVLLPFKGKIVHDGILGLHNVTFGGGIRRRMNESYLTAKQRGLIVETLEPGPPQAARGPAKTCRDWRPVLEDIVERAGRLKGGPVLQRAAFGVLLASAELARNAAHEPEDAMTLLQGYRQVRKALTRLLRKVERATPS